MNLTLTQVRSQFPKLQPIGLKSNNVKIVKKSNKLLVSAIAAPEGVDLEASGLKYLTEEAKVKALDKKANKFEKVKVKKCGSKAWDDVFEFAKLIREGQSTWEDLDLDDVEVRLKWAGLFHRKKRTPGEFMMRLKVPNGDLTAKQLRFLADCIRPYGERGSADITTRANIQLRGIKLEDSDKVIEGLWEQGLTSFQSGMDNVRNLTGSPLAGMDPYELLDVRPLLQDIQDMITNKGKGNPELVNLPRKLNICISPTRDDFPHTHINDLGFEAVKDPESGDVVFNVVVGGYFSVKRNTVSIPMDTCVTYDQVVPFCEALLKAFRDNGPRGDRQKTRLMWLVEEMGVDAFRDLIGQYMGGVELKRAVPTNHEGEWKRRDYLGVYPQKQEGYSWVGACVPAGRLSTSDFEEMARICEKYGDGTVRVTCEENVIFPFVKNENVVDMLKEPLFEKFLVNPGPLISGLVSCTGSNFCGFALIETKSRAVVIAEKLEALLDIPQQVRIHWTGCPNSCGQAQVGDIGLMGAPAKVDGKAVEGVKIFLGGKIGENAELAKQFEVGVPADPEYLVPKLQEILINNFGATLKTEKPSQPKGLGQVLSSVFSRQK
eukprot:TRINITY_DN993_c0_g2_i1.p1 TRINITY_DN993_c0_g2~~TRINITY_DN993_c0_g2_i1.p1  ORF type:complete len:603 (+),score=82.85 TRINITY_DN993_c0_g2_i1:158-1966(+)